MSQWGRSRRVGSLLLLVALAVLLFAASAFPRGAATSGGTGAKTRARTTSPVLLPRGRPLADTVLAVVGDRRTIDAATFRQGWAQVTPPARADSLTPESARRFLDLLIDKEALAERAVEETFEWTSLESAQVASLRDRTMMRTALDSSLTVAARARAARGEPPLDAERLGVAARESTVSRLEVTYEEALVARLAKAFASIPRPSTDSSLWSRLRVMGQMPGIDPADSARVVAWSGAGTYRVAEMMDAWRKLNPLFRPRIETAEQVHDLVDNGLFERVLRRDAELHHLERHPRVVAAVQRQSEYLAVQYFVMRDVYSQIPTDSLTLRRFYDQDVSVWAIPTRLKVVRLLLPERGEASRMAVQLRDRASAETLVVRGQRQHVDYTAEISAGSDSALFAAAMKSGTGTVMGPDSVAGGWQVVRVDAVFPTQGRSFDEVRDAVLRSWSDQEGERRMQALLATLRKRTRVVVNGPALMRLVKQGIPAAAHGPGSASPR
jgi:parvulin-like peptidyl-prolyl cis-trans isomerase-like protein